MKLTLHSARIAAGRRAVKSLAAFTMIEIALALAVIGFALVAIIGVLPAGMSVQKDNREETLINFDANFLMDAIRSGSHGLDDLTNHIISVTNVITSYKITGVFPNFITNYVDTRTEWFTTNDSMIADTARGASVLTTGGNIIGLLTIPKIIPLPNGFISNYVTVDFRGITGSLVDQGTSQSARDFAFTYRLYPEVIPYNAFDPNWVTNGSSYLPYAKNLQGNLTQIRLRFRWPLLPKGQPGTSRQSYRTSVSGSIQAIKIPSGVFSGLTLYYMQPQSYVGVP